MEGAVHIKHIALKITESQGIGRVGNKIYKHIKSSAEYGSKNGHFHFENDIIYRDQLKDVKIRDRSVLSLKWRDLELVPKEEIQKALIFVIKESISIEANEAISEALILMGFKKSTNKAIALINNELEMLKNTAQVKTSNDSIFID